MPTAYETAAALAGELRLYLNTADRVIVQELQSALGYGYACERDHRSPDDPWEYAFGDARAIVSGTTFDMERNRVTTILLSQIPSDWDADLMYHPPGRASAVYQWSSTEGTLHPYQTVNE